MMKWLVIGGVATLAYLLVTSKGAFAVVPGGKATPKPQGPPAQQPAPPVPPSTTVVPGASASFLEDAAKAAGIVGTLADAARKLGIFGSNDAANKPVVADVDPVGIQRDPYAGAAFY